MRTMINALMIYFSSFKVNYDYQKKKQVEAAVGFSWGNGDNGYLDKFEKIV